LLRACTVGDTPVPPASDIIEDAAVALGSLPAAAAFHRVAPWVSEALSGHPLVRGGLEDELRQQRDDSIALHLRAMAALSEVATALDAVDVRWVVVKGPALAKLAYARPVLRTYSDLDVLVRRADFPRAVAGLRDAGFGFVHPNWRLIAELGAGEVTLVAPGHRSLDLHWHPIFTAEKRSEFPIAVDDMIDRSRHVALVGDRGRVLDPADALLHLALHSANDGGDRMIWLKDLDQVVRHDPPDWDAVVHRARQWRTRVPSAIMLHRARSVFSTPVPDDVMAALAGRRSWRSFLRALDSAFPVPAGDGRGNLATLVARAARSTEGATLRAAAGGAMTRVRHLASTRRWARDARRDDPADPASLAYPAGDDSDREAFLAWVGSGA
jgi:hypothetical protein